MRMLSVPRAHERADARSRRDGSAGGVAAGLELSGSGCHGPGSWAHLQTLLTR